MRRWVLLMALACSRGAADRRGATVGFISEDLIAVCCHSGPFGGGAGTVSTAQWKDGELRVLATRPISRYRTFQGFRNGIFTRAVLVDIPRLKGLPYLEPGVPIYPEDLEAWEKKAGVMIWLVEGKSGKCGLSFRTGGRDPAEVAKSASGWLLKGIEPSHGNPSTDRR
jgi:hypothetical protein